MTGRIRVHPSVLTGAAIIVCLLLAMMTIFPSAGMPAFVGSMIIAGNGPELPVIERLARAFEKAYPGSVVEINWNQYSDPVKSVKRGTAHVAVTGNHDPDLRAIPIAWDGIVVVVYVANPIKELTTRQVASMFSGEVTRWSELNGQETAIQLIDRPPNQHIRRRFEETLGIVGRIPPHTKVARSDQIALSTVAGNTSAVTYASLGVAREALKYGVDVAVLHIDRVEPAEHTVKDGRYRLHRPVLLLSTNTPSPMADAFAGFVLSKEGQEIIGEMFVPYSP